MARKADVITAKLESSAIREAEYDRRTHSLFITFTSGSTYEYCDVPEKVYQGLRRAKSAGKYFHRNIRNAFLEA